MRSSTLKDIEFILDCIPDATLRGNAMGHNHWKRQRAKEELRNDGEIEGIVRKYMLGLTEPIAGPVQILVFVRNKRKLDMDSLLVGYKPFIDGLIRAGLLIDDNPDVVVEVRIRWEGKGEPRSRLVIRDDV